MGSASLDSPEGRLGYGGGALALGVWSTPTRKSPMPVGGPLAWAFRGHLSANPAFQMQLLHRGSGKVLLTPRWLSGPNLRIAGFCSGPFRAEDDTRSDELKRDGNEGNKYQPGWVPSDSGTESGRVDSRIAKPGRHRHREERGPDGRDSVRVGKGPGDSQRGPRVLTAARRESRIAPDSRRQLWKLHRVRIGGQPKTPRGRAVGKALYRVPGGCRSGWAGESGVERDSRPCRLSSSSAG